MLHRLDNSNCKFWRRYPIPPSEKKHLPVKKAPLAVRMTHTSTKARHARMQRQTIGRTVDLLVTRCCKMSKTTYTPLAPILQLLPSAAAEAGRMGFVVKEQSMRAKPVCVFLTAPQCLVASRRPCRPESLKLTWDTPFDAISVSQLAWHDHPSITEKEIWCLSSQK